jgi:alpha-L-arabinofuranosidase
MHMCVLCRYPGGCFAPFYRWKIGLLDADMQPPIETPFSYCEAVLGGVNAYTDQFLENGVGIDDYMALIKRVGAVPAITVRLNIGDATEISEAKDWVEYCNGDASTHWGGVRASRGHPEPYNVSFWYLGNEISQQARWPNYPADHNQMGPPSAAEYAAMLPPLVAAMKNASKNLKLLAVAGETTQLTVFLRCLARCISLRLLVHLISAFARAFHHFVCSCISSLRLLRTLFPAVSVAIYIDTLPCAYEGNMLPPLALYI